MAEIIENTPQRLVMKFSSNKLALDKAAGTAALQRKMMFWSQADRKIVLRTRQHHH
jgi:hypothetical protein